MADLVEQGGDPRPTVAERWRTECDRLMRLDRRSPEEVERVMRWALADEFWSSNVLSMPKLRAKFATLRRQAARRDRRGGIDWDKVQVGT